MKTLTIKNLPDDFDADNISLAQDVVGDPKPDDPVPDEPAPTDPIAVTTLNFADIDVAPGWKKFDDGIMWNDGDHYRDPTYGVFSVTMIVEKAGVIEPRVVSKAMFPKSGDDDNDCFMWFGGRSDKYGKPFKAYILNPNETTGISDVLRGDYGSEKHRIRPRFEVGSHMIFFAGRSEGFKMFRMFAENAKFLVHSDSTVPNGPTPDPDVPTTGTIGWIRPQDKPVVSDDGWSDWDCILSAVMSYIVYDYYNMTDRVLVISGARERSNTRRRAGLDEVLNACWGPGNWYNATSHWDEVAQTVANIAKATAAQGGRMLVAEGGPSNFTASVLRLADGIQKWNYVFFQHAPSNDNNTTPANLTLAKARGTQKMITNGNSILAMNNPPQALLNQMKSHSKYGPLIEMAFVLRDPTKRLDFSDTKAVLDITGNADIKNIAEFNEKFLG